jgi:HSP20 family molecular chaperone IbpA
MAPGTELQVQEKREVAKNEEATVPARSFVPETDIYETADALTVVMEMPGVDKSNMDIEIADGVLRVSGTIDFSKYEKLQPVYSEYNIGHYRRTFSLPNQVNQEKIAAEVKDGVLTLTLPKAEAAKPRKIAIG